MSIFTQPWRLVQNRIRGQGGREIDKLRGVASPVDDSTGSEAWIGSVTRVENPPADKPNYGCSEVILPDGTRMFLFDAVSLSPYEVLGKKHTDISGEGLGVLIKYLDAQRKYGLQCHPTRSWAAEMWDSPYGKEECWYVIGVRDDADEPPYVLLGFKEGVTREIWEEYYWRADIEGLENLCHKIEVKPGDAFFVGAGCPHSLGAGCFVVELQEPCDITLGALPFHELKKVWKSYPETDEDRHNIRLLGSYEYKGLSYEDNLDHWMAKRKLIREGDWGKEEIIIGPDHTTFFSLTEAKITGETDIRNTGFPQISVILAGSGSIKYDAGEMIITKGDEIFLPYNIPGAKITGDNLLILLCHPEGAVHI